MTNCKKCLNRSDCWIKNVINLREQMPNDKREQYLVLKANDGNCVLFEPRD